jgi:pimeloyl-ACP methyl ester carboxylesterase
MTNATNVETKHLKVGDVSYAYRELRPAKLADPTPLVFLQRFRGTLDDWDPAFVDELAKTRHVILFSNAAVGSSTGTPAKDVDEKARNVASFARKLGYEQIDVLGFSMGGFDCQVIAIQEPKLVRKVIVIGSGPAGNAETAPPTDIVFGIALKETYAFEDIRYLFFAEGREQETRAYIERMGIRKDREPVVGAQVIQRDGGVSLCIHGRQNRLLLAPRRVEAAGSHHFGRQGPLLSAEEHLVALSRACECAGSRVSARRPRTSPTAPHPGRGGGRALPFQEVIRSAGRTRQS